MEQHDISAERDLASSAPEGRRTKVVRAVAGAAAVAFGAMTILVGGKALAALATAAPAPDVVPFVLIFNVIAGVLYIATGFATLTRRRVAVRLALAIVLATVGVGLAFATQRALGGPGADRTGRALVVRSLFWAVQWLVLRRVVFASSAGKKR